ncbi:ATP-binding protein [Opitutus sp. ER46]|nr:ATP-binding protein [Opitutus sp. ER46]
MIESLRAFGYDLPSAIADLIDNSIFAGASTVWVDFFWAGEFSTICVTDNGTGMTEATLVDAMRPGSRNPLESRDPKDLGRYGLGLKTASFSQCRRLTVRTKVRSCQPATRCWDLAFVAFKKKWLLMREAGDEAERQLKRLSSLPQGTAVLWENMDRIVRGQSADNAAQKHLFHARINGVERHLAMVFHRFMEGKRRLKILVNDNAIDPWDPFLKNERATQQIADEKIAQLHGRINIVPFVLPHISKLTARKHTEAAGIKGWNHQQGFYVYRNERLLVAGDWLGLPFTKEEHFKLARIQLDIPNSMDQEWEIDVTKSKARPPDGFRDDLKRIAEATRARASEVYRHRGKVSARHSSQDFVFVWQQKIRSGKYQYRINREHPLVKHALAVHGTDVDRLLRLIEETVPIPLLAITSSEHPDQHATPFEGSSSAEVLDTMKAVFGAMRKSSVPAVQALERIAVMEPFDRFPELVESFKETLKKEAK